MSGALRFVTAASRHLFMITRCVRLPGFSDLLDCRKGGVNA